MTFRRAARPDCGTALNTALEEGSEEVLQDLAQSIVEKGTYNPDKAWAGENGVFDLGRALQNFGAGAILGGGFGAVKTPVRRRYRQAHKPRSADIQQAPRGCKHGSGEGG